MFCAYTLKLHVIPVHTCTCGSCHHYFNVLFQKISILPQQRVFWFQPPTPLEISSLGTYIPLKILAFKTPLPLGISRDPLWWRYGYFLDPHSNVYEQPTT